MRPWRGGGVLLAGSALAGPSRARWSVPAGVDDCRNLPGREAGRVPSGTVPLATRRNTPKSVGAVAYCRSMAPERDGRADATPRDEGLARRLKALACTAPLHDLDARKGRLDWCDASVYQMAEIALQIIDQVTIAMDFDRGADHDDVIRR